MTFPHLAGRAERLARELDLSPPAAQWVALAALHAGCFLRSQYCAYSGHSREAARLLVQQLIERRFAAETPCGELGRACRLTSKAIYHALGAAELRHHRRARLPVLYRRLLSLDYVLERPDLPWLGTAAEKLACFDKLGVPRLLLPRRVYRGAAGGAVRYFVNQHLIAVDAAARSAVFVYVDSEEQTHKGLRSWRRDRGALWRRLYDLGFRLSIVHAGRHRKLSRNVQTLFQHWARIPRSRQDINELSAELGRLEEALEKNDKAVLDEYGGFSRALSYAGELEGRLEHKNEIVGYEASYEVWLSQRLRPKAGERRRRRSIWDDLGA